VHSSMFSVNCSIIFTEHEMLRRPGVAYDAGFSSVEFWWPFSTATPSDTEVNAFVQSISDAGVSLSALNFFAGDMSIGERGILSSVRRAKEYEESLEILFYLAKATGCRIFNALYGNRSGGSREAEDAIALERLARLAPFTRDTGSVIVLEPISGFDAYPLTVARDALNIIDRLQAVGATTNVKLLADVYHLAVNQDSVSNVIESYASQIGHVQIADAPGRNEPGTGHLPIFRWLEELAKVGYVGHVGLEYRPRSSSMDCFDWIPQVA